MSEKHCGTCEFNFGDVCAGRGTTPDGGDTYGMPMEEAIKMFPNGCDDYGISLDAFIEDEQAKEREQKLTIRCKKCGKRPNELREYISAASAEGITPDEYVIREEGTYNEKTCKFYCTPCYVMIGMPIGKA